MSICGGSIRKTPLGCGTYAFLQKTAPICTDAGLVWPCHKMLCHKTPHHNRTTTVASSSASSESVPLKEDAGLTNLHGCDLHAYGGLGLFGRVGVFRLRVAAAAADGHDVGD